MNGNAAADAARREDFLASIVTDVGARTEAGVADMAHAVTSAPVFERHEIDGRTVLTAATVNFGGGFGFGAGGGDDPNGGGGGAGGGGGEGRPVAVIELRDGEVLVRPVMDWTKVVTLVVSSLLAVLLAVARSRRSGR